MLINAAMLECRVRVAMAGSTCALWWLNAQLVCILNQPQSLNQSDPGQVRLLKSAIIHTQSTVRLSDKAKRCLSRSEIQAIWCNRPFSILQRFNRCLVSPQTLLMVCHGQPANGPNWTLLWTSGTSLVCHGGSWAMSAATTAAGATALQTSSRTE